MLANAFDEEQCLVDVAVENQAATKGTTKTGARARASVLTAQEEKLASNMIEYFRLQPAVFSLVGVTIRDSTLARVAYVFAGFMFFVLQTGGIGVSVFSAG
jgi:phage tail tape-measure protein